MRASDKKFADTSNSSRSTMLECVLSIACSTVGMAHPDSNVSSFTNKSRSKLVSEMYSGFWVAWLSFVVQMLSRGELHDSRASRGSCLATLGNNPTSSLHIKASHHKLERIVRIVEGNLTFGLLVQCKRQSLCGLHDCEISIESNLSRKAEVVSSVASCGNLDLDLWSRRRIAR